MPSKYFLPKKEDLKHDVVNGLFHCEECDETMNSAKHFLQSDTYAWKCPNGHITKATAEELFA